MKLEKARVVRIIRAALKEDIGEGDITTKVTVERLSSVKAAISVNEECLICGIPVAEWVMSCLDYSVRFKPQINEGEPVSKGKEIVFLEGHAQGILTAERTMLNFLGFMSGVATYTKKFVEKAGPHGVRVCDTRKTLPLLRYLEKYAVSVGGGCNHRMGLWDQALVKDNHLKAQKGKIDIREARKRIQKNIKVEVEVGSLKELEAAIEQDPDIVMFDNMSAGDVKDAVGLARRKAPNILLEASGGITLDNVEDYAKTGVDMVSIGSLTDSVKSVDMSLEIIG